MFTIFFVVTFLLCVIFVIFLRGALVDFNRISIEGKTNKRDDLLLFSSNFSFNTTKNDITIENKYSCTIESPKICKLDDPSSCFGCKEMTATCQHFSESYKRIVGKNELEVLNKNNPGEGYCLRFTRDAELCNSFHGEFVLADLGNGSSHLICACYNPGYIGNITLNGACDTPFICGNKVKDINKKLEEIKCDCPYNHLSVILQKTPSCVIKTVENYSNFSDLFIKYGIPKKHFQKFISTYVQSDKFQSPCAICPVTGNYINGTLFSGVNNESQCLSNSKSHRGIPIRRSSTERLLKGLYGPDAVLDLEIDEVRVYGSKNNKEHIDGVVIFKYQNNEDFYDKLKLDKNTRFGIDFATHDIVFPGSFSESNITSSIHLTCEEDWPFYYCSNPNHRVDNALAYKRIENKHSIVLFKPRQIDTYSFPINQEVWLQTESINPIVESRRNNQLVQYVLNKNIFVPNDATMQIKGCFLRYKYNNVTKTFSLHIVRAKNTHIWENFKSKILKY